MLKPSTLETRVDDPQTLEGINRRFLASLADLKAFTLVTLGPEETSSFRAARNFCEVVSILYPQNKSSVAHFENFDKVYAAFKKGFGDFLLVPNAYEGITKMYWDPALSIAYSFLFPTPLYGLACVPGPLPDSEVLRVATCPAVEALLPDLMTRELSGKKLEFRIAASTTMSAQWVREGKADLAITNETSAGRFYLRFLATLEGVPMLWTLFEKKHV